MSAQRLSRRKINKLRAATGLNITRAWSHGGYWMDVYIDDGIAGHHHAEVNIKNGRVLNLSSTSTDHYSSCNDDDWQAANEMSSEG